MINIVGELIEKHSDEEIISHLDSVITGVLKNYKTSLEKGDPNILWGNIGDITLVASIIRGLKKRNAEREAQKQM